MILEEGRRLAGEVKLSKEKLSSILAGEIKLEKLSKLPSELLIDKRPTQGPAP